MASVSVSERYNKWFALALMVSLAFIVVMWTTNKTGANVQQVHTLRFARPHLSSFALSPNATTFIGAEANVTPVVIPDSLKPISLFSKYGGPLAHDQERTLFHWVITTCSSRTHWGRFLTSTLLSAVFQELQPATINIVYCKRYEQNKVPALLYNLRESHKINIFFPSAATAGVNEWWQVMGTALMVPTLLGQENIPLLLTEDDEVFAPDANARITTAVKRAITMAAGEPFYISLYRHSEPQAIPAGTTELPQPADKPGDEALHTSFDHDIEPMYQWGAQGAFYSPGMRSVISQRMAKMLANELPGAMGYPDFFVYKYLEEERKCNQPGSGCRAFVVKESIMQHTGTTSASYQNGTINTSFHMGVGFPSKVAWMGWEDDKLWKRRMSRRLLKGTAGV